MRQYEETIRVPDPRSITPPLEDTRTLITKKTILGRRYKCPENRDKPEDEDHSTPNVTKRQPRLATTQHMCATKLHRRTSTGKGPSYKRSHSIQAKLNARRGESKQTRTVHRLKSRRPFNTRFDRIRSTTKKKLDQKLPKPVVNPVSTVRTQKVVRTFVEEQRRDTGRSYEEAKTNVKSRPSTGIEKTRHVRSRGWSDNDGASRRLVSKRSRGYSNKRGMEGHRSFGDRNDIEQWLRRIKSGILETNDRLFRRSKKSNHGTKRKGRKAKEE